ncbi:sulfonate ABC transporter substrate-binding protein [Oxalobacteraceae bacterium OM1]|nr:sulfonate ABC transporter substrate-binding protein [Oxalobacteraceae bacterium OM1]
MSLRQYRRLAFEAVALLLLVGFGLAQPRAADLPKELHIGFQKSSVNLTLLKQRKALEQRLPNVKVTWFEFNAGPQMLEALSVGSIDFAMTGDTPPIFAQAAGSQLVYVGAEPAKPDNSAVLVRQDSPIRSVAELKGKKIALQKGSSAHYLAVRALQQAGIQWNEITPVYLAPADARAAFERGSVDAWVIWDPYWAAIERSAAPRALVTSRGMVSNHTFYLASRAYADKYPNIIHVLFEELTRSDQLVQQQRSEAVRIVAESIGLDQATTELYLARRPRSPVGYLTNAMLEEQQVIADTFHKQNLIPKPIRVKDVFWQPSTQGAQLSAAN